MAVPYYPQITITPNLGLSLIGMDEVIALDFVKIDAAFGGITPLLPGGTTGQVQYNDLGVFGGIAEGTIGKVLTSNGLGVPPSFQAAALGTVLETNGVPNTLQTLLNLKAGPGITVVSDALGGVTISSAGSTAVAQNPVFKNSAYLAVANDYVLCDTSGGGFTVTLPVSAVNKGLSINVKKISSDHNTLTIANSGADTIDEGPAVGTYQPNTSITFTADGITNWDIE